MSQETLEKLRAAVDTADLGSLEGLLAQDVYWYGNRGGACAGRDDVLTALRRNLDAGARPRLGDLSQAGDGAVLTVEVGAGDSGASWVIAVTLDTSGKILRMQDYESAAVAERDLTLLAEHGQATAGQAGPVTSLVPFVFVADVVRSVEFYQLLGLEIRRTFEPDGEQAWAMLDNDRAAIMFARADAPIDPHTQAVLFYLYTDDLAGLRDRLLTAGIWPGEIVDGTPGPKREMRVTDPDGYCLMIANIDNRQE